MATQTLDNSQWKQIENPKVKAFQLGDEPELIYVVTIRKDEYMVIHEDAYDLNTGNVEFFNKEQLLKKYPITL